MRNTYQAIKRSIYENMGKIMGALKKSHGDNLDFSKVSKITKSC